MADARKLVFSSFAMPAKGVLILFCEERLKFGPAARKALAPTGDLVERAAAIIRIIGGEIASLTEARATLGLGAAA